MKLKAITIVLIGLSLFSIKLSAQSKSDRMAVGGHLSQYQNDFGLGLHVISPYFASSTCAVRVGGNLQYLEHFDGNEITWTTYGNLQLGFRSRQSIVEEKIYIYGEGGALFIFPNSEFSDESINFGGYGVFGFEFKSASQFGYYLELGGAGSGATADKVAGNPIYSNGFVINVGFSFNL